MNMTIAYAALAGVYFLVATALIILILVQQKKSSGLGGGMGGMGSAPQTYWDKNKGRSVEGRLHKYTKILVAVMLVLTLILAVV